MHFIDYERELQAYRRRRSVIHDILLLGLNKKLFIWFVMLIAMCMAGMMTMAKVNIRPGVIEIQTPLPTASGTSSTVQSTTTAIRTSSAIVKRTTSTVTDCPSKPLANECNDKCKADNAKCNNTCSSSSACYDCDTNMLDCIDACPCRGQCPAGCDKCQNPICYFTEVLILSNEQAENVPVLTNAAGRDDKDFDFETDEEAEVHQSCSLTWQNELYVFGGIYKRTQISKVTSCRLAPIGQLAFDHVLGGCVNVAGNAVALCFHNSDLDGKKCRLASSPTGAFSELTHSQYGHRYTRIATNDELIVAVGSRNDNKAELLDVDGNKWSTADDYPFVIEFIYNAPIVHVSESFYLFGGFSDATSNEKTIGRLDIKTRKWTSAGNLVTGRHAHNAIYDGQFVLVVGGQGTFQTEKCSLSNKQVTCSSQWPELTKYAFYPELNLVPEDFCF